MIRCPKTGIEVWTGYAMSESLFADATFENRTIRRCAACGAPHDWNKRDAVLRPSPPASG